MSDLSPKVIRIRSTPKTIQLVPYWPDNAETWFLLAEADFCEHGITDQRSQLLAVIHALPREFSKCDGHWTGNKRSTESNEQHQEAMYKHPISIGRQTSRHKTKPLGRFFSPEREPSSFFYFRLVLS
uniref:Uncharacterized protein n=1 Tax=Trichobilharzia regenti TaxID=157069 RepID=A0AA85J9Q7_TRIRE|nr:unnamed protein product [Trichobilharzia regenti]